MKSIFGLSCVKINLSVCKVFSHNWNHVTNQDSSFYYKYIESDVWLLKHGYRRTP